MTKNKLVKVFAENEQGCCVCKMPLPAHNTWPGARHPFCGSPECSESLKRKSPFAGVPGLASMVGLYVGPNERKCEAPGCDIFIPEGRYDLRNSFHTCSADCWAELQEKNTLFMCGCGCGQQFYGDGSKKNVNGLHFVDQKHYGVYLKAQSLSVCPGTIRPIVEEFLDGFAVLHYREYFTFDKIDSFFEYLQLTGISTLDEITPPTVTNFLTWAAKVGRHSAKYSIPFLSTFFKWAIASGYRKYANPVVGLIHNPRKPKRRPRPLKQEESAMAEKILNERGNARLRFAAAVGEESGLRINEICRLRLEDIDLVSQRFFVRLPNKGMEERYAYFSDKTIRDYKEWMAERDPLCEHNLILHSKRLHPCNPHQLSREFSGVLCKEYAGKKRNDDGFEKWSTHRLRHTMASNLVKAGADAATVMASGGWKSFEAMCGYAEADEELGRQGYQKAMKKSREQLRAAPRRKPLTLAELLERQRKKA
jgi:integrase/recombinase XerC